jgi:adenine-specific DNA glycosylase
MELIFVYNADSNKLSAMLDLAHKIVSPESYQCNLCTLTHGNFTERKEWKQFRDSTPHDLVFLHKDEFEREYRTSFSYPIVLKKNAGLEVFIATDELNGITDTAGLIALVKERAR